MSPKKHGIAGSKVIQIESANRKLHFDQETFVTTFEVPICDGQKVDLELIFRSKNEAESSDFYGYDSLYSNEISIKSMTDDKFCLEGNLLLKGTKGPRVVKVFTFHEIFGEGHVGKIQEHVQTFEKVASLEIFYTIFMHVDKKEVAKKSLWKNHLKNALESGMFTDVTIVCCDGEFQAHKLVLTANNEYFRAMFSSVNKESTSSKVSFKGINVTTLKTIVDHLYTDEIPAKDNLSLDLLLAADMLNVSSLVKATANHLLTTLNPDNVIDILLVVNGLQSDQVKLLQDRALKFILNNKIDCEKHEDWKTLIKLRPDILDCIGAQE